MKISVSQTLCQSQDHILIVSSVRDFHAWVVRWALRAGGVSADLFETYHPDLLASTSVRLGGHSRRFHLGIDAEPMVIWGRRLYRVAQNDTEDDENEAFRKRESLTFQNAILGYASHKQPLRWVNNLKDMGQAENKLLQLEIAQRHGVPIPDTLFSSHPVDIRNFAQHHSKIVIKPYSPYMWHYTKEERVAVAFASIAHAEQIQTVDDADLSYCPAIYQSLVEKNADWRVVAMGEHFFAYRITQNNKQDVDYRSVISTAGGGVTYTPVPFPDRLAIQVRHMMRDMNVQFASMDFAEDKDGKLVFLDLNPGGNWLFLDSAGPRSLLQAFCCYLAFGTVDERAKQFPTYADHRKDLEDMKRFKAIEKQLAALVIKDQDDTRWHDATPEEINRQLEEALA